jgi:hypothetical protein
VPIADTHLSARSACRYIGDTSNPAYLSDPPVLTGPVPDWVENKPAVVDLTDPCMVLFKANSWRTIVNIQRCKHERGALPDLSEASFEPPNCGWRKQRIQLAIRQKRGSQSQIHNRCPTRETRKIITFCRTTTTWTTGV